jgi:hypothetical protein
LAIADNLREAVSALLGISSYMPPGKGYGPQLDDKSVRIAREALGGQLQPLPTTRLRWYLKDLEWAQMQADAGNIQPAAQLYRAMRRDGALTGLLGSRTAGLIRLPKKYYGDSEICDALRDSNGSRSVFDEMHPPAELAAVDADGVCLGIGIAERVPVAGRKYPVMVRLEPEYLQYRWNENRWYFLSIAGALPITPGDGRWVLHVPGPRMSPWTFGIWPALGRSFINKEHAMMHRSNYCAKLANPARAAVAPKGAAEQERRGFLRRVMAWGVNTVFEMPPGWDVKLIESNGRGIDVFQKEIDTSDNEYQVAITGQAQTTTGGAGFSNAEVPNRIREDLIEQDGESLAYTLNTQSLPEYIASNYGGADAITARATNLQWETGKPKELLDQSKTLLQTAQAIVALITAMQASGREVDVNALCERFGVPLVKGGKDAGGPGGSEPVVLPKVQPKAPNPAESTPEGKAAAERYAA